ncbi:MAG: deoxyribonuclease [Negativicutes bacterium]|nr:deoxyribonuclease [Negativicutes bacterium]
MTRINVVPVEELCDQHLLAEYRELPRVFALAKLCDDAPKQYVLGPGHVKFFYDKLGYIYLRFTELIMECETRGFTIAYTTPPKNLPINPKLWNDYIPTEEAIAINRQRLQDKMKKFTPRWSNS